MRVRRLGDGPIITPSPAVGDNINGPSLVRAPEGGLGRYHLYFAHHIGDHIRLAYADALTGPWTVLPGGVLRLEDSRFPTQPAADDPVPDGWTSRFPWHIASPDVHAMPDGSLRMYFHGLADLDGAQLTRLATSRDGLRWQVREPLLCRSYLRAFAYDDVWYGVVWGGWLVRSPDGVEPFTGARELWPLMRHSAVHVHEDVLYVFYSRWHDEPERILVSTVELSGDWETWTPSEPGEVLRPERDWEGVGLPVRPSRPGAAVAPVHELRDPCIFTEDGSLYLLYSVAGERGIAIAELALKVSRSGCRVPWRW